MLRPIFSLLLGLKALSWTRVTVSGVIIALLIASKLMPRDAADSLKRGFADFIVAASLALNGFASVSIRTVDAA